MPATALLSGVCPLRPYCREYARYGPTVGSMPATALLSGVCPLRPYCREYVRYGPTVGSMPATALLSGVCPLRPYCREYARYGPTVGSMPATALLWRVALVVFMTSSTNCRSMFTSETSDCYSGSSRISTLIFQASVCLRSSEVAAFGSTSVTSSCLQFSTRTIGSVNNAGDVIHGANPRPHP